MSTTAVIEPIKDPRGPWFRRLPVISHFNKSVGLQRGMLVAGLVLTAAFLLTAIFAPLIAPFGFSQISDADGGFPAQQAPGGKHLWGTTVGGYDVFSRVVWGAQTAVMVIVVAVVMSIFIGVVLGLVSGYIGGWLDRILVVIPALNEAECIATVIERARQHPNVDILVIDDGSTDDTSAIALQAGEGRLSAPLIACRPERTRSRVGRFSLVRRTASLSTGTACQVMVITSARVGNPRITSIGDIARTFAMIVFAVVQNSFEYGIGRGAGDDRFFAE